MTSLYEWSAKGGRDSLVGARFVANSEGTNMKGQIQALNFQRLAFGRMGS